MMDPRPAMRKEMVQVLEWQEDIHQISQIAKRERVYEWMQAILRPQKHNSGV
jgi:hypothetical protein